MAKNRKVSLRERRAKLAQRRKEATKKRKIVASLPKQGVHVAPDLEKTEEKVIPVPFMVWVGKVIASWAFSRFLTYLWNKIRSKKEEGNAK